MYILAICVVLSRGWWVGVLLAAWTRVCALLQFVYEPVPYAKTAGAGHW